jgi:hypothetical protein
VAAVAVVAIATAVSSFWTAKGSIESIEMGRKAFKRKQEDRKKLARKLWGLRLQEEE